MTKLRPALSYERALIEVAGTLGWAATAQILDLGERAARNLSDPDIDSCVRLDTAQLLDEAFRAAGGLSAPFFEVYRARLELSAFMGGPGQSSLTDVIASAAREGGEAIAAALVCNAKILDPRCFEEAERELGQAIAAHTFALAALRRRRRDQQAEGSKSRGGVENVTTLNRGAS